MNKLKLDLEALSVQSFEPEPRKQSRGTVVARETSWDDSCACEPSIDYPIETCGPTCYTNCGSECWSRCGSCTAPLC